MGLFGPNIKKMEKKGDIEGLCQALQHKNAGTRENAALALERLAWMPQDIVNTAWYLTAKGKWQELTELGEPALTPLIFALQHADANSITYIGGALEKVALSNPDSAVPMLSEAICDPKQLCEIYPPRLNQARGRVVGILGKLGDARAVIPLVQSWEKIHSNEFTRNSAVQTKKALPTPISDTYNNEVKQAIKEIGETAIAPLIELDIATKEVWKYNIPGYISAIGTAAVDPLIKLLENNNEKVCSDAISALGHIGDKRAFEHLVRFLQEDKRSSIRMEAVRALAQMNDDRALEHFVKALKDKYYGVRTNASLALMDQSWQPANIEEKVYFLLAQYLLHTARKSSIDVDKSNAVLAMGEQAVAPLIRSLNLEGDINFCAYEPQAGRNKYWAVASRKLIENLLISVGKPARPALEGALNDPDPIIRQEAQEALKNIRK